MSQDSVTIETLYDMYYRDVYRFALYYTNNKNEAEDITQETFMKAMKNLSQLQDVQKVKLWILSIAKHTAIDHQRKARLIPFLPAFFTNKESHELTPEQAAVQGDEWEMVQRALLKLKPHYRSLIILKGIKEFSIKETAEILGCTELKVRVDFHRAMTCLRREIDSMQEGWESAYERSK